MKNTLYPVFLKLDRLKMLIVGAGEVGCEPFCSKAARMRILP
jgi:siroheme synthase (precorrin-2 oxidase/ferrochelatase)